MLRWRSLPKSDYSESWRALLPGVVLLLTGAAVLFAIDTASSTLPTPLFAVLLGLAAGRVMAASTLAASARAAGGWLLKAGIVLLGLRFSIEQLHDLGMEIVSVIVPAIAVGFSVAYFLGRWHRLRPRECLLVATGTAICGNSAIIAAAPALGAEDDEVAVSVAAITIYGTIALLLFPFVGAALGMNQDTFGLWAGTAINDTSQVIGAGFAFGEEAGERATIVKLARNLFMVPAILGLSVVGSKWRGSSVSDRTRESRLAGAFPLFVLGFLATAGLNTAVDIPEAVSKPASTTSKMLILGALISVGVGASRLSLARAKGRPLWTGILAGLALAAFSFGLLKIGVRQ